jgi:hypothetical protein
MIDDLDPTYDELIDGASVLSEKIRSQEAEISALREALENIKMYESSVMKNGEAYADKAEHIDFALEQCVSIATEALQHDDNGECQL